MKQVDRLAVKPFHMNRFLVLVVSLILLGTILHLPVVEASAGMYFNSSEPGCDGTDPDVLWCDDFEDGDYGWTFTDPADPRNDGWLFTPRAPECGGENGNCQNGTLITASPLHGARCGGVGAGGTNCTASSGPTVSGSNYYQAPYMGDHNLASRKSEIYFRYYIKKVAPFTAGGQKHLTFNRDQWDGGIWFANLTSGGQGPDLLPPQGSAKRREDMLIPAEGQMRTPNIADWSWVANVWFYIEVHLKLNTPGVANGVYELWVDNCGPTGTSCPASPTLRAQHTNVRFRSSSDNSLIGDVWLENWANPKSSGEEYYDQIKVATRRVGPMNVTGTGGSTPPGSPTNLRVQ